VDCPVYASESFQRSISTPSTNNLASMIKPFDSYSSDTMTSATWVGLSSISAVSPPSFPHSSVRGRCGCEPKSPPCLSRTPPRGRTPPRTAGPLKDPPLDPPAQAQAIQQLPAGQAAQGAQAKTHAAFGRAHVCCPPARRCGCERSQSDRRQDRSFRGSKELGAAARRMESRGARPGSACKGGHANPGFFERARMRNGSAEMCATRARGGRRLSVSWSSSEPAAGERDRPGCATAIVPATGTASEPPRRWPMEHQPQNVAAEMVHERKPRGMRPRAQPLFLTPGRSAPIGRATHLAWTQGQVSRRLFRWLKTRATRLEPGAHQIGSDRGLLTITLAVTCTARPRARAARGARRRGNAPVKDARREPS
jgi:hypothetical protein